MDRQVGEGGVVSNPSARQQIAFVERVVSKYVTYRANQEGEITHSLRAKPFRTAKCGHSLASHLMIKLRTQKGKRVLFAPTSVIRSFHTRQVQFSH